MAIDESLLTAFNFAESPPILRLYGWNPPTLSLGRFQKSEEVLDLVRCRDVSLPIVRRVSGGGAIYHSDELTYSIICSADHVATASSVKDSFRILTGFLLSFYRSVGLDASYAVDVVSGTEQLGCRTAFCFAGKESFDILVSGKKIGGNAQRRQKNVIFQHGSIPIVNRSSIGLGFMRDRTPGFANGTVSLEDCGVVLETEKLKSLLLESFKNNMAAEVEFSPLNFAEQFHYKCLYEKKYTNDRWNLSGESR